jgi:hypothetical protein
MKKISYALCALILFCLTPFTHGFDTIRDFGSPLSAWTSLSTEISPQHGLTGLRIVQPENREGIYNGLQEALCNPDAAPEVIAYFNPRALRALRTFEHKMQTMYTTLTSENSDEVRAYVQTCMNMPREDEHVICVLCKKKESPFPTLCMTEVGKYSGYAKTPFLENFFSGDMHTLADFVTAQVFTVGMVRNLSKMLGLIEQKGIGDRLRSVLTQDSYTGCESKTFLSTLGCWITLYTGICDWCTSPWLYCTLTQNLMARPTPESLFRITETRKSWWARLRRRSRKNSILPITNSDHPIWGASNNTSNLDMSFSSEVMAD